ncbi:bifunctional protein-serine/threonine kinase/phosphatase [Psychromonas sp. RZ22]|uniref:bifunctional protein-serine/threonine kinase/phosphatase n=1 Tax=Psychromonas algarum TaxID=2555643 RepID=UPI00106732A4|nr:bifunctional protein-serine/threonine kinase/phosphatase [Psychromonas sp. RZ22]TEW55310.1 bifunctional protein-serine/threonine kinase/phosphatase [Psychromonas sp. RZ22]
MASQLQISSGQYSDKGVKAVNQDSHGIHIPNEPLLTSKGIAIAVADGISSSDVSQIASEASVRSFLEDYFCTSETWSVNKSAQQVLIANNSWLHSQTQKSEQRFDKDKGYICTFSAIIIKSTTAHVFHIGDSRIYLLRDNELKLMTEDHRHWVSEDKHYLSRGMGFSAQLEIDYQTLQLQQDDIFILATDGIYDFNDPNFIIEQINENIANLQLASENIAENALKQGSDDNLTIQIIKVDDLPELSVDEVYLRLTELPFPPILEPRMEFDGYQIIESLHDSSRSHIYLAIDIDTQKQVVLKTPSIDLASDAAYLERFLMEEWVARRINNAHVLKPCVQTRKRNYIYVVTEFIQGQTLTQWMIDNPKPDLETVRGIVEQISKGLLAFHRQEMIHQDLRPENIMIDHNGIVKIIDFGSTKVAGLMEISSPIIQQENLGTAQYTAPEYFLGEQGASNADIFSLGVITYQMLTGQLPFGAEVAKSKTKAAQKRLRYRSVLDEEREIPAWLDDTLWKALNPNPEHRYHELSEFLYELRHPSKEFLNDIRPPLLKRDPVLFWKSLSGILTTIIILLLYKIVA